MNNNHELKKACKIGTVTIFSYLVSYYMRNMLSVCTPDMLRSGIHTTESVGVLSSTYFLLYALGQLINGIIGDMVKPKRMIACGTCICGVAAVMFAFTGDFVLQVIIFGIIGFSMSMLRGPIVKTISENTLPQYARICCVFLTVVSFLGPFVAGLLTIAFKWNVAFIVAGVLAVLIGVAAYTVLTVMEKQKIVKYTINKSEIRNVLGIFKLQGFVFYMFVGILTELITVAINFWIPTYFSDRLGFPTDVAKILFSIRAILGALAPFAALAILKKFKENDIKVVRCAFLTSMLLVAILLFSTNKYVNVVLITLAYPATGCASAMLWSVYIPGQAKSGKVSTINGVFDFMGYAVASVANVILAFAMRTVGWNGIIIFWIVVAACGVSITLPMKKIMRGRIK